MSKPLPDCTISINGGPDIPLPVVRAALDSLRVMRPADARQTDMEDDALGGRNPDNEAKAGGLAADRLRSLVERIERLETERKDLGADIRDVFQEAKSAGFDTKVLRTLIAQRKKERSEIEEQETLLDVYRRALGM